MKLNLKVSSLIALSNIYTKIVGFLQFVVNYEKQIVLLMLPF